MRRLLFLNGEYTHTVDIVRLLKKSLSELRIHVLLKNSRFSGRSKSIDQFHFLPPHDDIVRYVEHLNQVHDFEMIFPVGYPEIEIFSQHKSRFKNIWVDDYGIIARALSKKETLKLAEQLGIPIPRSLVLDKPVAESMLKKNGFSLPLFVKSERETTGKVRGLARTSAQLQRLTNEIFRQGGQALIQEFIPDSFTYGVGVLAERGRLKKVFCHEERLSYPPAGGSGVILAPFSDNRVTAYAERLISSLGYTGLALTEFKYSSRRQDFVLMEINAKFWASIKFALESEPSLFPWLDKKPGAAPAQAFLFPDRFVSSFRYAPLQSFRGLLSFLSVAGHKQISLDPSDLLYEGSKLLTAGSVYLPRFLKAIVSHV
jgi:predicted ATP-grasp superfamily ATP-dependent carboligase